MTDKRQEIEPAWAEATVISEKVAEQERFVANVIDLLDSGATIPFIARYRKEKTGDMAVKKLQEINVQLGDLRTVKSKMSSVYAAVNTQGKMTKQLELTLRHARTMEEVEMLYAPYKPGHKGSLAERAKALGLESAAMAILDGRRINVADCIKPGEKGLSNKNEVETGIQHIIADIIAKDKEVMEEIRKICATSQVVLESKKSKASSTNTKKAADAKGGRTKKENTKDTGLKGPAKPQAPDNSFKYEQYFNFQCPVRHIKPHQILAINRGEEQKVLTVKIIMPDGVKVRFTRFVHGKFVRHFFPEVCRAILEKSIEDSFDRLVQPQMCRHIRSEHTKEAEKASISVFGDNLHRLLLSPPVKGKTVLGVDPGFKNGCKVAVVSATGQVLHTAVLYLHDYKANKMAEQQRVVAVVKNHSCDVIAIGNGVACRETEQMMSDLIQRNCFHPLSVVYCIVDEGGASIYSVSDEAQKEMPDLDPTLRGAVSIARRLQDPLSELVKIEPKHIGVGMYQHDVSKTKLQTALDGVVEQCVSFTGVDLNTASQCLLRRVAGLNVNKANKIIEWRTKNGRFTNRSQLLKVKGLGEKSYEQCAGFVRVVHHPGSEHTTGSAEAAEDTAPKAGQKRKASSKAGGKGKKAKLTSCDAVNPLDMTAIHPESYLVADRFISELDLSVEDVCSPSFIGKVKMISAQKGVNRLAEEHGVGAPTMQLIVEALSRPLSYDFRSDFQKPLFKKGMTSISDLKQGAVLTGRVTNVTHFGAFVDIGVGQNGLIHVSKMRPPLTPTQNLGLGDHVEVMVLSVETDKNRIGLQLKKLLHS